ncbi:hypothetical protein K458DRAFT_409045 [Lentithecium fluviatile CBS 122367]|uniref:RTA1-domain-containing protein n=1 Tax=Lentithecium fluviatile CBS 122367 TaxID=1168545 RepID=A0A6G1IJA1_9PLEO|nr:hypothetical protein K458DRAFT_409045 [Lentithecium fluviatile CBS 122367]
MATSTSASPATTTTPTPTSYCTTAVPGKYGYVPPDACNAQWAYAPSFAAAVVFALLFGLLTLAHIALAISFRKGFCWVVIMGVAWEFASFIIRAMAAHDQQNSSYSLASTLLFLLAPLWVNAYVYMTAGRLIWAFHPEKKIWGFKAISIGKYFVWLDILSFLVQGAGGTMLSPGGSESTMTAGKNIYMSGVGVQQAFILLFTALIVRFQLDVQRLEPGNTVDIRAKRWLWVTFALYAALVLISIRIIFRLVEFSAGTSVSNPLPYHEEYALVLDAFPMTLAILILAVVHSGLALKGPESQFPSRKERKAEKKKIKAEKKALKQEKKRGKKGGDSYEEVELNRV